MVLVLLMYVLHLIWLKLIQEIIIYLLNKMMYVLTLSDYITVLVVTNN